MSKQKSHNLIEASGDLESSKEIDNPCAEMDPLEKSYTKHINSKTSKRQYTQSCSMANVTDFIDVDCDRLKSKDDSHKEIYVNKLPYSKNSRKSRTGIKEHKKGGGGKAVWNKTEEYDADMVVDKNDPNYESDEVSIVFEEKNPFFSDARFDDSVTNWIQQYYENREVYDILKNLDGIGRISKFGSRLPYLCIVQALQRKPAQCELTSRLLNELMTKTIHSYEMISGFDLVMQEMSELTIDCPGAPEIVGKFIARAVADNLLQTRFITRHKAIAKNDDQTRALAKAENLLSESHAYAQLDTVWGLPGGERPTQMLISKIRILLAEYLDSDDEAEAGRCLRELEAPHFHHELVFQAILMVLERSTDFACNRMIKLLESLCTSVIITIDQFEQGINRLYDQMPDVQLDVPAAYVLLERFVNLAMTKATFFPSKLRTKMPKSTRPRFLSEGRTASVHDKPT